MTAIYVHIPFCRSKCAYCDFYSGPFKNRDGYVDALLHEAAMRRYETDGNISTIYLGGGTPSTLDADEIARLLDGLRSTFDCDNTTEVTIEVNPEDVTADYLSRLRLAGVNRVSMGIQSLVDNELSAINRRHDSATALNAVKLIKGQFDNYSCDLIFGLPGQTLSTLEESLEVLVATGVPHLSCYLLSYEPGTLLHTRLMTGKVAETSDETATAMYMMIHERLARAGYEHYEISNYALPTHRAIHNSSYWDGTPYLGLGPAAHSFDGLRRRYNPSNLKIYLDTINNGSPCYIIDEETDAERFNDYIITRLRTIEGIDLDEAAKKWPLEHVKALIDNAMPLILSNKLVNVDNTLRIDSSDWLVADDLLRRLIID